MSEKAISTYYVISGELEVVVGGKVFILRAGDTLIAPRDIPHQLRNSGKVENHYLIMFSPSGFEGFLKETAIPAEIKPPRAPSFREAGLSGSGRPRRENGCIKFHQRSREDLLKADFRFTPKVDIIAPRDHNIMFRRLPLIADHR
jgi:hypothetical protein